MSRCTPHMIRKILLGEFYSGCCHVVIVAGSLMIKSGTVRNLTLKGSLNGADLKDLVGAEDSAYMRSSWDELNVLNLTILGRLAGRPVWELLGEGKFLLGPSG